jgi:hypothetical protein
MYDFALHGNTRFSGTRRTKAFRSIDKKFCIVDYVDGITDCAKLVAADRLGAAPTMCEIYADVSFPYTSYFNFSRMVQIGLHTQQLGLGTARFKEKPFKIRVFFAQGPISRRNCFIQNVNFLTASIAPK